MEKKILFIDSVHPLIRERFEAEGFICDYYPDHSCRDYSAIIHDYTGIIIRSKIKLDRDILQKASNLMFIGRVGAGMESIDVEFAESNGIKCFNSLKEAGMPWGSMPSVYCWHS
ncbi:MAG: hypothetical protein U5Q03_10195 [Bacteroidota bacterium]|nr:hypothetical protein [Bacteroidota bacterium]